MFYALAFYPFEFTTIRPQPLRELTDNKKRKRKFKYAKKLTLSPPYKPYNYQQILNKKTEHITGGHLIGKNYIFYYKIINYK